MHDGIVEQSDGTKYWYLNSQSCQENNKITEHCLDDIYHMIEYPDGSKYWYLNDQLHRTDGPAIEHLNGTKYWYIHDKRHRVNGPAIELSNGLKYWYLHGIEYTETEYQFWIELCVLN